MPQALVVDDDVLILMDVTSILEDAGFEVLDAMNVAQAPEVLAEYHERVELLFTDVQMPGDQTGFDLARQTAARWPHIAIVVASGQIKPGPGDMPEGATFIGKPFSANLVRKHLRETLAPEKQPGPLRA